MYNLATMLQDKGRLGRAKSLFLEALEGRWDTLGPTHSDTRNAYTALMNQLTAQGATREARELKAKYGAAGRK